jgi:hypothetical protein
MPPRKNRGSGALVSTGDDNMLEGPLVGAANAAQKAGLVKALLLPSAKALGDYMGNRTQEWVEGLGARRAKNVAAHSAKVKAAGKVDAPVNGPTERQFNALMQWTEQAQAVDPDLEPELAAFWQSLLADIYANDPLADELQVILKEMTRGDAQALLSMHPNRNRDLRPPYVERFKRWGLTEARIDSRKISQMVAVAILGVTVAIVGVQTPFLFPTFEYKDAQEVTPAIAILFGGFSAALIASIFLLEFGKSRLSPLGRRLWESGNKYFKMASPVPVVTETRPVAPEPPEPAPRRAPSRRKKTTNTD